jgi:6-phosphogluconolactonase
VTTVSANQFLNRRLVYVGTYTEPILFGTGKILAGQGAGIYLFTLDVASGALEPLDVVKGVRNPSYLAFDPAHRFLYAVNELKEFEGAASGAVSAFAVDPENGSLTFLNHKPSHGTDPCHLAVDTAGAHVLVANFMSGSVCVLPILEDGSLGDATDFVQHHGSSVDPVRQTGPHAHAVTLDLEGRFLFVPDLGLDKLVVYEYDAARGKLQSRPELWASLAPGAGPRQVAFHPHGRLAYLINELNSTISAYRYDGATGALSEIQTVPTLPADFAGANTCAEVQVGPSGKFLFGSNRGHDSIVIYAIDEEDGTLTLIGHMPTQGQSPRNFAISPDGQYLIAANQDTNNLVTFKIDPASGQLTPTGYQVEVPTPVCVRVISAPPGTVPADVAAP